MKKNVLLLLTLITTSCSVMKISNNYTPLIKKEDYDKLGIKERLNNSEPTVIKQSSNVAILDDEVTQDYLNEGYLILGYGTFISDSEFDDSDYKSYAATENKSVDVIIHQSQYKGSRTSNLSYSTPTSQTTYHSGSAYNSYGSTNYYGSSTTYGSKLNTIPITVHTYANAALFLSKSNVCEKSDFGLGYNPASKEIQKSLGTRDVFVINRVCKNSSAYKAGLFIGDIFIINNRKPASENKISIKVFRNNKTFNLELNSKS